MFGVQHDKLCYSIGDAAALLSVGRRTLYREISAGRIATAKMGKRTLVPTEALRAWLEAASKPARPQKESGR
jgi:excisionase family DNA binding protein